MAAALLRPLAGLLHVPLLDRLVANSQGASMLGDALLNLITTANWTMIGRGAIAANVIVALIRALIALDAAAAARARRAASTLKSPFLSATAGVLAAAIVLVPHAALGFAGYKLEPLLAQVLAPPPKAPPVVAPVQDAQTTVPADTDTGPPVWDGTSRLNVLLLGTDRRPQESEAQPWGNSDTILLVSVDPGLQGAAMISVPRDLYLQIPGVGLEKINAAYREGGPSLATKVVGDLLGQPIHRWASIDTTAFAKMIDSVGGVVVDVERPIRDDEYPNPDYSIRRIYIPAGLQWLDGERALWYARSRHETDDFDRGMRQQRIMLSLEERLREPGTLRRLPVLMDTLAGAVQTDITPKEALALARLGATRNVGAVRSLVLQPPQYGSVINRPDLYAITPNATRIRQDVAAALSPGTPGAPLAIPNTVRALPELPLGVLGQGGGAGAAGSDSTDNSAPDDATPDDDSGP
jgi:LCP family protein required for cell wall assembly